MSDNSCVIHDLVELDGMLRCVHCEYVDRELDVVDDIISTNKISIITTLRDELHIDNHEITQLVISLCEPILKTHRGERRFACMIGAIYISLYILHQPISREECTDNLMSTYNGSYKIDRAALRYGYKEIRTKVVSKSLHDAMAILDDVPEQYIRSIDYAIRKLSYTIPDVNLVIDHYHKLKSVHNNVFNRYDCKTVAMYCVIDYAFLYRVPELFEGLTDIDDKTICVSMCTVKLLKYAMPLTSIGNIR